ncbi:hypothetical protein [Chitinophaga sp. YIM B06452]|uniref:hypothetical protein n=1 Tax=Chitinophaga sp. YIM B06452 TaxID=3082158 RepID=UPI0031FED66D
MDIGFEIMIPVEAGLKLSGVKFKQPAYEWDGVEYPQGPEEADFYYIKLMKLDIPKYVLSLLPDNLKKTEWQCITVIKGINELKKELMLLEDETKKKGNKLFELLNILIGNMPEWCIVFDPDYNGINEVIEGNINIAYQEILNSLLINPKGFLVWKNKDTEETSY